MNHRHIRRSSSWSELPPELLYTIAVNHLNSNSSIINFRTVCKNWRSSIPPPFLHLHSLTPHIISSNHRLPFSTSNGPFLIVSTAVYLLRPPFHGGGNGNSWLVAVEQPNLRKLRLLHPLMKLRIECLPENFPKMMVGMDALKLSEGFGLKLYDGITNVLHGNVNKVVLWRDPRELENYSVLLLYGKGVVVWFRVTECIMLLVGVVGRFRTGVESYFDDVVTWKGMGCVVGRKGKVYLIDYESMEVSNVVDGTTTTTKGFGGGCRRNRLLSDCGGGGLYMIVTNQYCSQFKVYKVNDSSYTWEKVVSLGDKIMFVSVDTCFFANSRDFRGLQGNCIVFGRNCFPSYSGSPRFDDRSILFQGASGYLEVGVYDYGEGRNVGMISTFLEFPPVFWPPPQWIRRTSEEQKIKPDICCENGLVEDQELDACTSSQPSDWEWRKL